MTGNVGSAVFFVLAAASLLAGLFAVLQAREGWGFIGTFVCLALAVAGLFIALFPDVMPSSTAAAFNLTTSNASSTHYTLTVMTIVAVIMTPIVLAYQAWTYWVFRAADHGAAHPPGAPRGARRMRPTDPRLVRRLAPARRPLAGVDLGRCPHQPARHRSGLAGHRADHGRRRPPPRPALGAGGGRCVRGPRPGRAAHRAASRPAPPASSGTDVRREVLRAVLSSSSADSPQAGETAVLVTRGVSAAEPYLTRYLPALVLASVLPLLTVVVIATQDVTSAVIVLATLPLIPVFGALVGLATRDRAERQWRAMSSLSGYFLDVMRGLPTLVAFRRAEAQTSRIREVTERYRKASLETLRIAFASSAVLELVATLSVALVAVTVGVRLDGGRLGLQHGPRRAAPGAGGLLAAAPGRRRVPRRGRGRRDLRAASTSCCPARCPTAA